MPEKILYIIPTLLFITFIILILTGDKSEKKHNKKEFSRSKVMESPEKSPYHIKPEDFNVGVIDQKVCRYSNLCNDTVLKPITPVDVDYGWKMPEKCPCTMYIEAP
jgi:hypothetical protein